MAQTSTPRTTPPAPNLAILLLSGSLYSGLHVARGPWLCARTHTRPVSTTAKPNRQGVAASIVRSRFKIRGICCEWAWAYLCFASRVPRTRETLAPVDSGLKADGSTALAVVLTW